MEPYASYIVDGKKRWEIRRYPTKVRGRVGIVSGGKVIGTVEITDSRGPVSLEELEENADKHLADMRFLKKYKDGKDLYVWELKNAERFPEPVEIEERKGQVSWIKLKERRKRHS
ncbi:MAG: ASCH domain-containing protein [Thermoplasmata archaeon]|nr:ASCH domain-containing protein [Thermoplasmata archaeon]